MVISADSPPSTQSGCEIKTAPVTSTSSSADYSENAENAEISAANQEINNRISKTYHWSSSCFIHFPSGRPDRLRQEV
jgi:hypothetical protein